KVNRADLSDISGSKFLEHALNREQSKEKPSHRVRCVGPLRSVFGKGNWVGDLVGTFMKIWRAAERTDQIDESPVKISDRHRGDRNRGPAPIACIADHRMGEEIEAALYPTGSVGYQRSREPARIDVERGVQGVFYPRRGGEPILPDDLRVQ